MRKVTRNECTNGNFRRNVEDPGVDGVTGSVVVDPAHEDRIALRREVGLAVASNCFLPSPLGVPSPPRTAKLPKGDGLTLATPPERTAASLPVKVGTPTYVGLNSPSRWGPHKLRTVEVSLEVATPPERLESPPSERISSPSFV